MSGSSGTLTPPPIEDFETSREFDSDAADIAEFDSNAYTLYLDSKSQMEQSGNIKTSIKEKVLKNLEAMYDIVLQLGGKRLSLQMQLERMKIRMAKKLAKIEQDHSQQLAMLAMAQKDTETNTGMTEILNEIRSVRQMISSDVIDLLSKTTQKQHVKQATEINKQLQETGTKLANIVEEASQRRTYAEAAAATGPKPTFEMPKPSHTIIVSSTEVSDSSEDVLTRVRGAADARSTGLAVERIRKAKDQKVIISCASREMVDKLKKRLKEKDKKLKVDDAKNKDPLIIIRNVLNHNKDEEIVESIKKQNKELMNGIPTEEIRAVIKYRRRTRNPQECHVVLQVSPRLWRALTSAGRIHIDLQRCTVADQSPLVQCTKCLGYGHGKRYCTATVDSCSHCGGSHLRPDCPLWKTGERPTCINCHAAKVEKTDHSAFDGDCLVRKRWDAIARSSVSYY